MRRPAARVVLALVILATAVLLTARYPATLLRKARRVGTFGSWSPGGSNYFWLSDRTLLLIQPGAPTQYGEATVRAFRVGLPSQAFSECVPLETLLNTHRVVDHVSNWQVSPDGRWLLAEKRSTPLACWCAVNIETGKMVQRPHQYDEQEDNLYNNRSLIHAVWRQDSGGWIQATEGQADNKAHVFFYDLSNPLVNEHAEDFMIDDRNVIGCYSTERVLAVNSYTGDGGAIGFADFSALPTAKPRELYFQYVPANMNVRGAALSPHADRIAWLFEVRHVPLGLDALRNSNYVRHEQPALVGLWTSKLDCSDLREVGTLDIRDGAPTDVRWTPDGKRLNFLYKNDVYTVPAN